MVFWCGGGLFSAPEAIQRVKVGQGFFLYCFRRDVREFLACPHFTAIVLLRLSLPWCFGVAEGCFQHRRQYNGKRLAKLAKGYF